MIKKIKMAKFIGTLGIVSGYTEQTYEGTPTGVYKPNITEYVISGDLLQNKQTPYTNQTGINKGINLNQRFSFIASPQMLAITADATAKNFSVYLELWGTKWQVNDITINPPRVTLATGGIWIEETQNP